MGQVEANITDIWPVRVARCNCPRLDHDELEWLNPAANTHGQSVRIQARVMPEVERYFQHIISTRAFPYKTVEDIIRHAINRHVIWLDNQDPIHGHFIHTLESILILAKEEQARSAIEETLPEVMKVIRNYAERGYLIQANALSQKIYEQLAEMREGPHKDMIVGRFVEFLNKLVEEVKRRYPQGTPERLHIQTVQSQSQSQSQSPHETLHESETDEASEASEASETDEVEQERSH
jgi:hypothetical protein